MTRLPTFIFFYILLASSFVFSEELSIASWNIKTIEVKKVNQVDEWNERLPYLVPFFDFLNFDVLGMQEATKVQIDSLLNRMPQYHYVGRTWHPHGCRGHQAVPFRR